MIIQGTGNNNNILQTKFNKINEYQKQNRKRLQKNKNKDDVSISQEGYKKYQIANENKLATNFDMKAVEEAFNLI